MMKHGDSETRPRITEFSSRARAVLLSTCALFFWPGPASTQDESVQTKPGHAHMKDYGVGWECDRGYRLSDEKEGRKV